MLITRPFSEQVRDESLADHRSAEDAKFIVELMKGSLSKAQYGAYLSQFQAIYTVLDQANADLASDPLYQQFSDPRLARSSGIAADLRVLNVQALPTTAATDRYVARLQWARTASNLHVVAHHYTRYLGDLSGGRIIASRLGKFMDLTATDGLAFYQFPDIEKLPKFKQRYREQLDALALDGDQREVFIEEVRVAYRMNAEVFASLEIFL